MIWRLLPECFVELFLAGFFIARFRFVYSTVSRRNVSRLKEHVRASTVREGLDARQHTPRCCLTGRLFLVNTLQSFVRPFGRDRCGEFLEAWITPKRIEHWIKPEQSRGQRHVLRNWPGIRDRE